MITYPTCPKCEGSTKIKHIDKGGTWYTDCDLCQGYGDMRINVLPDLSDADYDLLDGSERFALREVFGIN